MDRAKVAVIARREYLAMVRTKSFLVSVILVPALMAGSILIQTMLAERGSTEDKTIVVVDRSGVLADDLAVAAASRNAGLAEGSGARFLIEVDDPAAVDDARRLHHANRIRGGEVAAYVEIGAAVVEPTAAEAAPEVSTIAYHAESLAFSEVRRWFERSAQQAVIRRRLLAAGLDDGAIAASLAPAAVVAGGPYERGPDGGLKTADREAAAVAEFAPLGLLFLIFIAVMMTAQPALQAVIEEKQQRIAEVLLGSASPTDLMFGKLVGLVGVSLTLVGVYLGMALGAAAHYGFLGLLPPALIAWMLGFVALAVMLYGAVFIAVGAAVSDLKESQNLIMPMMILLMAPLFVWTQILAEPLGSFSTVLSLIPPMTPMLMPMRLAVSSAVPLWQPLLGLGLTLLTVALVVAAAGRIFRVGILSYGQPPRLGELLRWALRGDT